jgi:hypothetical protein
VQGTTAARVIAWAGVERDPAADGTESIGA